MSKKAEIFRRKIFYKYNFPRDRKLKHFKTLLCVTNTGIFKFYKFLNSLPVCDKNK